MQEKSIMSFLKQLFRHFGGAKPSKLSGPPDIEALKATGDVRGLIKALSYDKDSDLRQMAVKGLSEISDVRTIDPLLRVALKDQSVPVQEEAARALAHAAVRSKESQVRQSAVEALGKLGTGDSQVIDMLISYLSEKESYARQNAAEALGQLGKIEGVEPLIGCLSDSNSGVRSVAIDALKKLNDSRTFNLTINLLTDRESTTRRAAIEMLGLLNDPRVVEPLVKCLSDSKPSVRSAAAQALQQLGDTRAVEPLIECLKDEDRDVRSKVVSALGHLGDPRAIEPLKAILAHSPKDLRQTIVDALTKLLPPQQAEEQQQIVKVNDLINILQHAKSWEKRVNAAQTLGSTGDLRAVQPLVSTLSIRDWHDEVIAVTSNLYNDGRDPSVIKWWDQAIELRRAAVQSLGTLGDPEAIKPLIGVLEKKANHGPIRQNLLPTQSEGPGNDDEDISVQVAAVHALAKIGTLEAKDMLETLILKPPSSEILQVARQALQQIQSR
jgi:HEAT repeat protein